MFSADFNSRPSAGILNALREHDDFMESIQNLVDLGCGSGDDLIWWATQTTRDDSARPLNIRCVGVDKFEQFTVAKKYPNMTYQPTDFEKIVHTPVNKFDILWCHDAFQYCRHPLETLIKWRDIASAGAMLVIAVPQTIGIKQGQLTCDLPSGVFYHHTMVSLIYMLSLSGWDCRAGFFQQRPKDPWIRAVVYNSDQPARPPESISWYDLMDTGLLPETAEKSIHAHGYLRQQDLVLPWLDHNLYCIDKV